jgi:hypothetical protein
VAGKTIQQCLHGILTIENVCTGGSRAALSNTKSKSLGSLIGAFKTVSTKHLNKMHGTHSMARHAFKGTARRAPTTRSNKK